MRYSDQSGLTFTIVSIGNNSNVKPDWPELPLETVVKSNLIGQNHPVNQENHLYNGCRGKKVFYPIVFWDTKWRP